ncbi:MAG TPA: TetR/AcrR family transcriptional regulator [Gemmatimonadales bacterium]|jgi:AcrR family transcriptional regulator|nr:TetR/AcrR family transcriptional regulator [Gemmatimonadales bacterium]
MASSIRRDGEATRQRLLRAALELFTTTGFRATTTPAIAERAGVAEGTIYRHFPGKEQLLNEVYRAAHRWAAGLVLEPDGSLPPADRLQRIGRRLLEGADRDPAAARMLLLSREERHLDERSRDAAREFRGALQQVIASGKSDGVIRAGPAELWAAVWLQLVAFAAERIASREWSPDQPQVAQVLDAAWAAIKAAETGSVPQRML